MDHLVPCVENGMLDDTIWPVRPVTEMRMDVLCCNNVCGIRLDIYLYKKATVVDRGT
jgi:hypothetical protein